LFWDAQFAEGFEISQRALAVIGEQVSADRCRLLGASGLALSFGGSHDGAEPLIRAALSMAEDLHDPHVVGEMLYFKTCLHWSFQQLEAGLATARKAEELLRSAGDLWTLAGLLWIPEFLLTYGGRLDEAEPITKELLPLVKRLGHEGARLSSERNEAIRAFMRTADLNEHEAFWQEDLVRCKRIGAPWISNSYNWLGQCLFWRGRWQEALEQFREAARLEPAGMLAGFDRSSLLFATASVGDEAGARALLEERREMIARAGQPNTLGAWAMLGTVVETLYLLGDKDEAFSLYATVLDNIGTGMLTRGVDLRLVQSVAGIAAIAGEQWKLAEEHFQTALRQAHEIPVVTEQPEVRRWYARMLIERNGPGDGDHASQLLDEAIAMYRKIGMPKHVELAEAMLAKV
jgi:tetratricopeptide (TPR) repeat protein